MSIDIWIENAPEREVEEVCHWCDEENPRPVVGDCPLCSGKGVIGIRESVWPTMNMSNVNALSILSSVGVECEEEFCGEIEYSAIPYIRRQIFRTLSTSRGLVEFEYIERKLTLLDKVLAFAQKEKHNVVWG